MKCMICTRPVIKPCLWVRWSTVLGSEPGHWLITCSGCVDADDAGYYIEHDQIGRMDWYAHVTAKRWARDTDFADSWWQFTGISR